MADDTRIEFSDRRDGTNDPPDPALRRDEATTVNTVECVSRTHAGRDPDKQVNEDASVHRFTRHGFLAVVCDGMGGHEGGRDASHAAIETVCEVLERSASGDPRELLARAVEEANRRVFALGGDPKRHGRPGSTIVAALVRPEGVHTVHVGDSRMYRVQNTSVLQVTKDHSAVQGLVDAGILTPEAAAVHPEANRITRALGIAPDVVPDVRANPLAYVPGDTFLLCSDGLSDLVKEADMLGIVQGSPLAQAAGQLVDLANARGGYDNITVVLFRTKATSVPNGGTDLAIPAVAPTALLGGAGGNEGGATVTALIHPVPTPGRDPNAVATTLASGAEAPFGARDAAVVPVAVERARTQLVGPAPQVPPQATPEHVRLPHAALPPPHDDEDERSGRPNVAVILGVVCALLALAVGAFVAFHELRERGGKHHDDGLALPPPSGALVPASGAPSTLLPTVTAPATPGTPSVPAATESAVGSDSTPPPELEPLRRAPLRPHRGVGSATPENQGNTP